MSPGETGTPDLKHHFTPCTKCRQQGLVHVSQVRHCADDNGNRLRYVSLDTNVTSRDWYMHFRCDGVSDNSQYVLYLFVLDINAPSGTGTCISGVTVSVTIDNMYYTFFVLGMSPAGTGTTILSTLSSDSLQQLKLALNVQRMFWGIYTPIINDFRDQDSVIVVVPHEVTQFLIIV